jgi:outer membrane protein OmpA-like peptidoglycan-associated protein
MTWKKSNILHTLLKSGLLAVALSFPAFRLPGQERADGVSTADVSTRVDDDSLWVYFNIDIDSLTIGRQESLTLLPRITDGAFTVELPAVVFSGTLRRKFDARRRALTPETPPRTYRTYGVLENKTHMLEYDAAVPWSAHLLSSDLLVEYRYDDCCHSSWLKTERHDLPVVPPEQAPAPAQAAPPQPPQPSQPHTIIIRDTVYIRQIETLHLEYPVNRFQVLPDFGNNRTQLGRLDALLHDFHGKIRITAYASPEGTYANNRFLAKNRAEGFREYLRKQFGIPDAAISTDYVAEDWEGMRQLIVANDFSAKNEALSIIDGVDVRAGREKKLLDLRGGAFWREFLPYFRQLRRIEVEILWKE